MCCAGDQRLAGLCHPPSAEEKDLNMNAGDPAVNLQTSLASITCAACIVAVLFLSVAGQEIHVCRVRGIAEGLKDKSPAALPLTVSLLKLVSPSDLQ